VTFAPGAHWLKQGVVAMIRFLPDGHVTYYAVVQGPDILRNVIVSGYVTI